MPRSGSRHASAASAAARPLRGPDGVRDAGSGTRSSRRRARRVHAAPATAAASSRERARPVPLSEVAAASVARHQIGIGELDRGSGAGRRARSSSSGARRGSAVRVLSPRWRLATSRVRVNGRCTSGEESRRGAAAGGAAGERALAVPVLAETGPRRGRRHDRGRAAHRCASSTRFRRCTRRVCVGRTGLGSAGAPGSGGVDGGGAARRRGDRGRARDRAACSRGRERSSTSSIAF